jgi:NADH-quinone oxidoreductase subunit G
VQRGQFAIHPPADAREDWKIIRAFSGFIGKPLPYDDLAAVRARLEQVNPVFARIDILPRFGCTDRTPPAGNPAALGGPDFADPMPNYYQTDPISRASPTMAACVREIMAPTAQAAE